MRSYEATLPKGAPWSNARYFAFEEDADDVSTFVIRASGGDATALGSFLVTVLGSNSATAGTKCAALLTANESVPYGVDLVDPYHAVCWRAFHIHEIAARAVNVAMTHPTTAPTLVAPPPRLPLRHVPQIPID